MEQFEETLRYGNGAHAQITRLNHLYDMYPTHATLASLPEGYGGAMVWIDSLQVARVAMRAYHRRMVADETQMDAAFEDFLHEEVFGDYISEEDSVHDNTSVPSSLPPLTDYISDEDGAVSSEPPELD